VVRRQGEKEMKFIIIKIFRFVESKLTPADLKFIKWIFSMPFLLTLGGFAWLLQALLVAYGVTEVTQWTYVFDIVSVSLLLFVVAWRDRIDERIHRDEIKTQEWLNCKLAAANRCYREENAELKQRNKDS
jgi:hypothetical protein